MSAPAIQAALQQMQALSAQASGQGVASQSALAETSGSFAGELQASLGRINEMQQTANQQAMAFQAGDPNVALNDVMIDMQKASVSFDMGMQVRNRLVTAYKEIMGLQV